MVGVLGPVLAGAGAFVVMEPLTYAAHRWVMHGAGWVLHRSHHRRRRIDSWRDRFEANDWFPVMFATGTVAAMAVGAGVESASVLVPVGVGVTLYGAAYAFVHDVYIHARVGRLPVLAPLERLRDAHAIHHLFGGEPYGMLCPIVPRELRERAAARTTDPLVRRPAPAV
ncbi:beta-carotene hydroxylase [Acidimicrobiaceae bacterium USS-CC1]|uniref:Beta-carotene hydroxylase n=1 Tax=Acidiferrimicrobium australe TaxID=2664430 RepID=A0ABW9QVE1_9ACTN|nr:beta-carotene hydroxylase [Acidiferrimicrobium australe]